MKYCINCGEVLNNNTIFCPKCGNKVQNNNNQNQDDNSNTFNTSFNQLPKTKSNFPKWILIVGGILIGIIALFVFLFYIVSSTSNKLICKSSEGNITIMYDDKNITGYTTYNITYDMDDQKKVAEQIGIDEYISQFNTWFKTHTTGTCTIEKK